MKSLIKLLYRLVKLAIIVVFYITSCIMPVALATKAFMTRSAAIVVLAFVQIVAFFWIRSKYGSVKKSFVISNLKLDEVIKRNKLITMFKNYNTTRSKRFVKTYENIYSWNTYSNMCGQPVSIIRKTFNSIRNTKYAEQVWTERYFWYLALADRSNKNLFSIHRKYHYFETDDATTRYRQIYIIGLPGILSIIANGCECINASIVAASIYPKILKFEKQSIDMTKNMITVLNFRSCFYEAYPKSTITVKDMRDVCNALIIILEDVSTLAVHMSVALQQNAWSDALHKKKDELTSIRRALDKILSVNAAKNDDDEISGETTGIPYDTLIKLSGGGSLVITGMSQGML